MAVKKKPRKRIQKAPPPEQISVIRTSEVPIVTLKMYYKNPNQGDTSLVMSSIKANGQFRPVVVNIGNFTERRNEILAGNHTYMAMRKLGYESILASFVDVDNAQAARIVLADNKTRDGSTTNEGLLVDVLEAAQGWEGTGYSEAEVEAIFSDIEKQLDEQDARAEREDAEAEKAKSDPNYVEPDSYSDGFSDENETPVVSGVAELKGKLPDDVALRAGYWGIPALREDMLMTPEEMPEKLDSWAGTATANWPDPEQWWLYNWRIDSTSGMRDLTKIIVAFYTWDDYFENWFKYPDKFAKKLQKAGVKYMVTPDYSLWDNESRFMWLQAIYKSRYVGRYMQEAGIKIIPDFLASSDRKFMDDHIIATLPKKCPMLSFQFQTNMDVLLHQNKRDDGKGMSVEEEADFAADWQHVLDKVKPRGILLYTTDQGYDWFKANVNYSGQVFYVETRMRKMGVYRKLKAKQSKTI